MPSSAAAWAGLSAAWQLARGGLKDFVLVDGPEFGGNAAGGNFGGDLAFRAARTTCRCPRPNPRISARCWRIPA
ncbi:hypothetical protein ACU4HD_20930 [Cupriavidus basilensis]